MGFNALAFSKGCHRLVKRESKEPICRECSEAKKVRSLDSPVKSEPVDVLPESMVETELVEDRFTSQETEGRLEYLGSGDARAGYRNKTGTHNYDGVGYFSGFVAENGSADMWPFI